MKTGKEAEMDDHLYALIFDYAGCDLIPRFKNEYLLKRNMRQCSSYDEIKALCKALNAVAPYAGYGKVTPGFFIKNLAD